MPRSSDSRGLARPRLRPRANSVHGKHMLTNQSDRINLVFNALADPTHRGIVERLRVESLPVGTLAAAFPMSRPAISQHLDVLERAGVIVREKSGRSNRCVLKPEALEPAFDWMAFNRAHWTRTLDALALHLESEPDSRI